jgi:hypothetical protein
MDRWHRNEFESELLTVECSDANDDTMIVDSYRACQHPPAGRWYHVVQIGERAVAPHRRVLTNARGNGADDDAVVVDLRRYAMNPGLR